MYIKVTPSVAQALGVKGIRNKTADGNYLLWQADLITIPALSVEEKAAKVGGVALTPNQAKEEIDGVDYPVTVSDPYANDNDLNPDVLRKNEEV